MEGQRVLKFKQAVHFLDTLLKNRCLRVKMQGAVYPFPFLIEPDGKRDTERIPILQSHRAFDAHHIGGSAYMIIAGLHNGFESGEHLPIAAAKGDRGLIMCDQLIAGTRSSNGIEGEPFTDGIQLLPPYFRVGNQLSVRCIH